jgi:CheY-like chemotaxis protein
MNSLRILIADDNRDGAMGLGRLLGALGHRAHVVHDGAAAVGAVAEFRPQVVLLDLGMPGLSGLEAAAQMQALPEGKDVILVALTGWDTIEDRRRTEAAGFAAHLVKPLRVELLEATLREIFAARSGD